MMKSLNDSASYREISVFECGKEECVKNKAISLAKKDYHLFHYVISGKGTLVLNKKEYHLGKGEIFFIPKNTDAIYFPDKENPWCYEWVGFYGEKVDAILNKLQITIDNPILNDKKKVLKHHFDTLVANYLNRGCLDLSSIGQMYSLFGEMLYEKFSNEFTNSSNVTIQVAKTFIENNYQFDISIVDIARNANVTPNYLSAIFKKEEGISTKQYLVKIRMEKALNFLKAGIFKIKEVSEMVGYANQLHFSSEFKKYYGKSPIYYLERRNDSDEK